MLEGPGPEICKAPGAWVGVGVEKEAVGVAAGSLIDIEVLLMTRTGLVEEKKAVDEDLGVVSSLGFQMSHILLCYTVKPRLKDKTRFKRLIAVTPTI